MKRTLRLYAPFLVVILLQALLVGIRPTTVRQTGSLEEANSAFDGAQSSTDLVDGGAGGPADLAAGDVEATASTSPSSAIGGSAAGAGSGPTAAAAAAAADLSHCTRDGRQFAELYHAPPCAPKWRGGGNGGATYRGVTATEIQVSVVLRKPNATLDALLATQGLAYTQQEQSDFIAAAEEFINKRYEFYGRTLEMRVVPSPCEQSPPDIPCWRELAKTLAKDSFAVMWVGTLAPEFLQELSRNRTVSLGSFGMWPRDEFVSQRPYRYDYYLDGTTLSSLNADYYCKKLAGKPVSHSGSVIHAGIGNRGIPRNAAILSQDDEFSKRNARALADGIKECTGASPAIFTFAFDTPRFQEQATAITVGLIEDKITTVYANHGTFMAFLTREATRQRYSPEWLLAGMSPVVDSIGRLHDPQQWQHAFGASFEGAPLPPAEWDATKVWKASGRKGNVTQPALEGFWQHYSVLATMLQLAGPQLTPVALEQGLGNTFERGGWTQTGGRADVVQWRFGPGDYTAMDDAREVYWSNSATSTTDGQPGAYVAVDGGRRYEIGRFPTTFAAPATGS